MDEVLIKVYFSIAILFLAIVWMNEPTFKRGRNTFFEFLLIIFISIIWPISFVVSVWLYSKEREKKRELF